MNKKIEMKYSNHYIKLKSKSKDVFEEYYDTNVEDTDNEDDDENEEEYSRDCGWPRRP